MVAAVVKTCSDGALDGRKMSFGICLLRSSCMFLLGYFELHAELIDSGMLQLWVRDEADNNMATMAKRNTNIVYFMLFFE